MGEEAHPAKKLPVRVFNPAIDDGLVTEVVLKLEDVQSDHQSGVDGRGTFSWDVGWMERLLELLPIDFVGEADQGVIGINDGDEPLKPLKATSSNRSSSPSLIPITPWSASPTKSIGNSSRSLSIQPMSQEKVPLPSTPD